MRGVRCKNCLHDGVCCTQEVSNDIDEWLDEFGCHDFKPREMRAEEGVRVLIDFEALLLDIHESVVFSGRGPFNPEVRGAQKIINRIKEAPPVDPESLRPHGKWILGEPDFYGNRKPSCSVCGEYPLFNWADYARCKCCPNCGAKMER